MDNDPQWEPRPDCQRRLDIQHALHNILAGAVDILEGRLAYG